MNKNNFEMPIAQVIVFCEQDIITRSVIELPPVPFSVSYDDKYPFGKDATGF